MTVTYPSSLKIAHTADLHLDSGHSHGTDGPDGLNSRFTDFASTWLWICKDAVERKVDLFVFAGDLAKTRNPSPTAYRAFKAGLDILAAAGIPVLLVTGNHDLPAAAGKATAMEIFASSRVFVSTRPELYWASGPEVTYEGRNMPQVATLPSVSRSSLLAKDEYKDLTRDQVNGLMTQKLMEIARGLRAQMIDGGGPKILVAHHSVSGATTSTDMMTNFFDEPVLPLHELQAMGLDAIMLGHIHKPQFVGGGGSPLCRYPGSPERIDFGEENDHKSYTLWEFGKHLPGGVDASCIPTPARRFVTMKLEYGGIPGADVTDAVVRVQGKMTEDEARQFDRAALAKQIYAQGASKVMPIELEIERETNVRDSEMTEAMGPVEALVRYMTNRGTDADVQDVIKTACEKIIAEVAS
ncbi:MAG: exonuclease SbcCD subunit D [Thermoleophilia bacterium]